MSNDQSWWAARRQLFHDYDDKQGNVEAVLEFILNLCNAQQIKMLVEKLAQKLDQPTPEHMPGLCSDDIAQNPQVGDIAYSGLPAGQWSQYRIIRMTQHYVYITTVNTEWSPSRISRHTWAKSYILHRRPAKDSGEQFQE